MCIIHTLWFVVLQDDVLTVDDFIEAIICNLQDKPAIYHAVSWLQASMNNPTIMQALHSLREKWHEMYEKMDAGDIFDRSLLYMQPVILYHIFIHIFILIELSFPSLQFLTLIRSRRREDLNIQSSLISSLLRRSSRLPLVQCSVTMPNMPVSRNRPRNKFRFSWRMSLS